MRILKITVAVIAVVTAVFALSLYLFGTEPGFVISILILADIFFLYMQITAIREHIRTSELHRKGCRTQGTLKSKVLLGKSAYNIIEYQVNGENYECRNGEKFNKWEIGCNEIPLIYDPADPENTCLEKYSLTSAISSTVILSAVELLFTGATIYAIILAI